MLHFDFHDYHFPSLFLAPYDDNIGFITPTPPHMRWGGSGDFISAALNTTKWYAHIKLSEMLFQAKSKLVKISF